MNRATIIPDNSINQPEIVIAPAVIDKKMTVIVKDNSEIQKNKLDGIKNLVKKIGDKTLGHLEKECLFIFPEILKDSEDGLKEKQKILEKVDNCYRTGNIMGFLGFGDERLTISSRFSSDNQNDHFTLYMLSKVLKIPNIIEFINRMDQKSKIFDFLLFFFPHYLKKAMRKGPYKTYIRHRYNDSNIKGKIDINRHLKKNIPFIGNVAYEQRFFSYDNHIMELIRHTVEFIKNKPLGHGLLERVKNEVSMVIESTEKYRHCDREKILLQNRKNILRHSYFHEYQELQKLCIMILQHEKFHIPVGEKPIYGIVFDGSWLWEEYINSLIGEYFYHPDNRKGENFQYFFTRYNRQQDQNNQIGRIFPDFIGKNGCPVIADAKYKPIDNINGYDYFQILAYMFRFEAKTGYFFYPCTGNNESKSSIEEFFLNGGTTFNDGGVKPRECTKIIKYGLPIPSADSFDDFHKYMLRNENTLKSCF